MYPLTISDEEASLGFRLALVSHERREFASRPPYMPVVLFSAGPFNCVFKVVDPDGNVEYSHRQYGSRGKFGNANWMAVRVPHRSPKEAVIAAESGAEEAFAEREGLKPIEPALPEVGVPCRSCRQVIAVRRTFLTPEDEIKCGKCGECVPAAVYFPPEAAR